MGARAYEYDYEDYEGYEEEKVETIENYEDEEFLIEGEVAKKIGFAVVAGMGAFIMLLCPPAGALLIFLGAKAAGF